MKTFLITLLSLQLACGSLFAKSPSVVIRSLDASDYELGKFLEVYGDHESLAEFQLKARQSGRERKRLIEFFEKAQKDFLGSSFAKAKQSFKQVADLAHRGSWLEKDRVLIYSSYIRLAQLSPKEADMWLEEAARFSLDLSPDEARFPPPLVRQAIEAKAKVLSQVQIWQPTFWESVATIVIDGRIFRSEKQPAIPLTPGLHNLEVYSNMSLPDFRVLTRDDILKYTFPAKILAGGDCTEPSLVQHPLPKIGQIAIFYSMNCVKNQKSGQWSDLVASSKRDVSRSATQSLSLPPVPEHQEKKPNRWILYGLAAAALAGAYLIYDGNRQSAKRVEPTHESNIKE
jgi:hypothetical protein